MASAKVHKEKKEKTTGKEAPKRERRSRDIPLVNGEKAGVSNRYESVVYFRPEGDFPPEDYFKDVKVYYECRRQWSADSVVLCDEELAALPESFEEREKMRLEKAAIKRAKDAVRSEAGMAAVLELLATKEMQDKIKSSMSAEDINGLLATLSAMQSQQSPTS